jgi:hypothetical protein
VKFVGLKPPEMDVPLIELETTAGEVLDLYNENSLRAVVFDADGLAFEFISDKARLTVLRFRAIRKLRVAQPPDWAPEESSQIEHLLIRRMGPWPRVVFKAGGLDYEFDCGEICLAVAEP